MAYPFRCELNTVQMAPVFHIIKGYNLCQKCYSKKFGGTLDTQEKQNICVTDIVRLMEKMAPPSLAEEWDNCGLQVGAGDWPVRKVWVALDPLFSVMEEAARQQIDLVITHHPLIFKPLHRIDVQNGVGKVIASAITSKTAIYAAHTNLDSVHEGINDLLADKIGLQRLSPLLPFKDRSAEDAHGTGEQMAGLGRIGVMDPPVPLRRLALEIKDRFGLGTLKVAGDEHLEVRHVAVCSGSGGGLMDAFLKSEAQVYVSGDLRYHDARSVEETGRALIDVGHFASEQIIIQALVEKLDAAFQTARWNVDVSACQMEQDPFMHL